MKFFTEYPVQSTPDNKWTNPDNIATFARGLESAGFSGLAFTDHPAPSQKWLDGGGHETFDPFAALTFCAGVTEQIRLMTHLIVVPYRNPLLMARSMLTVDILSKGRATFALGTGYLRSEFGALGVDMDERNDLFDEAIEVLNQVWSDEPVTYEGRHFTARGQTLSPGHVQQPHPPLWIGGNSALTLRRVAKWAQGWSAMVGPEILASSTRTTAISSAEQLATRIGKLSGLLESNGRTLSDIDISASPPEGAADLTVDRTAEQRLDELGRLSEIGVTWVGAFLPHDDFNRSLEAAEKFSEEVISKLD